MHTSWIFLVFGFGNALSFRIWFFMSSDLTQLISGGYYTKAETFQVLFRAATRPRIKCELNGVCPGSVPVKLYGSLGERNEQRILPAADDALAVLAKVPAREPIPTDTF